MGCLWKSGISRLFSMLILWVIGEFIKEGWLVVCMVPSWWILVSSVWWEWIIFFGFAVVLEV